ncbi:MAG: HIT family protein [Candidatus Woesearchaeota archaeon]
MPDKEVTEEDLKNMSAEEIAELQKQNCIFCKIAEKKVPAKIIHENDDNICILDINPASEGHILVYPKKHYMILPHIPDDALSSIFKDVKLMSNTLLKTLQCRGTTIFIANGSAAGQKAPHVLIHVFPRRENDGLVKLPEYEMSDEQIDKLKMELKPYMDQIFGFKKNVVRDAEFVEDKKESLDRNESKKEQASPHHGMTHHEHKKVDDKDSGTHLIKKDSKDPKNNKVDLDDIAKLFGG